MKKIAITALLLMGAHMSYAADTSMYPKPDEGEQVHIIELPKVQDEDLFKVEVMPGKMMEVDCNHYGLGGAVQQHTVDGWGYDYYRISGGDKAMSTMMACPGNTRHRAFVQAANAAVTVRYNSKLPIVIYAPKDMEVKYRIWKTESNWQDVK